MISRRNIRVKVMQALYSLDTLQNEVKPTEPLSILNKKIEQSFNLYTYLIFFITEVAHFAEKDAMQKAAKHLPTNSDLNINTKISGNELMKKITSDPAFKNAIENFGPQLNIDKALVKKIYQSLTTSSEYNDYINLLSRDKKSEKNILEFIFTDLMLPNEDFTNHIEELFINWDDDASMMNLLVQNFLQKPDSNKFSDFITKEKREFAVELLQTVISKKDVCMELITPKLKNWDADRIAHLDMIIIQMGICEFLFFETIPTKVTINEYIDLAKEYSTKQSGQFVNGILDNIYKELSTQNKIHKKSFKNSII